MTWPSSFPAGTLGYMKDRIDDELKRSGTITTQIAQCIADAITIYQAHRFRFSESRDLCQFNTVIGQEFYRAADNAAIATLYLFDYLVIQIGNARFEVARREPEDIELMTQSGTQQGQPQSFSYFNETIRFYPVPSAVYPIIVSGHMAVPAPAADATTGNRWMLDGERLIRSRAKYELSVNYAVNFPELAQIMHPETGATADAYSELKQVANKVTGTGRVRPTQF